NATCNVPVSYHWTVTGGTLLSANNGSSVNIQWTTSGNGSITLTATHAGGCDSTIVIPVTINPKPTPVINGPGTACAPSTGTYSLMIPTANNFSWSVSGGTILGSSTGNNITVQWNNVGTELVSITKTNSF